MITTTTSPSVHASCKQPHEKQKMEECIHKTWMPLLPTKVNRDITHKWEK